MDDEDALVINHDDVMSNGMNNSIHSEDLLILREPSNFINHKSSNILT